MIIIKAVDAAQETKLKIEMESLACAENVFKSLTLDPPSQGYNWFLIQDEEIIDWHCPLNRAA